MYERRCGKRGRLMHCWWECEVTATTEKSTKVSQKAACRTTMMQRDISERHRHTHAYYTIHES